MGGRVRVRLLLVVLALLIVGAFIGSAVSQWWPGPAALEEVAARIPGFETRVRVEVLNAGGVDGRAGEATTVLRDRGFDVVYFGNDVAFGSDSSVVLDRVGKLDAARAVADALGIREVRSELDSNLYVDVSVKLGEEWTVVAEVPGGEDSPRGWWDPRGWFGS
jgi:hypothetical protein